jgi:hypothetical protein
VRYYSRIDFLAKFIADSAKPYPAILGKGSGHERSLWFVFSLTRTKKDVDMPPKQLQVKRKRQLVEEARKGREARKKLRLSMMLGSPSGDKMAEEADASTSNSSLAQVMSLGDSTSFSAGPSSSFTSMMNPPPTGNTTPDDILKNYSEEWKNTLDTEDLKSLALFLLNVFTTNLEMTHARATDHTAKIMGKTDRTIRQWRADLIAHGEVRESRKGKHARPKVLWANKELNDKARAFVEANTAFVVQGKQSTMKIKDFCEWVNETLLPNQAVASLYSFVPGYGYAPTPAATTQSTLPRKVSMETARKWLRELGF